MRFFKSTIRNKKAGKLTVRKTKASKYRSKKIKLSKMKIIFVFVFLCVVGLNVLIQTS